MTVRVRTEMAGLRRSSKPRKPSARSMLEHLLDPGAIPGLFPDDARPARVAVVRGFDVTSRELRGAARDAVKARGHVLLDVPSSPGFGAVPDTDDVWLVLVTRSSLIPHAERCAAFWGAPVVGPAVANSAPAAVVVRAAPGLRVTTDDDVADGVASRLAVSGPVRYRIGGGPRVSATSFGVEPSTAGILVQSTTSEDTDTLRIAERLVEFELHEDTEAMLDGHPVLLPEGEYLVEPRPEALRRVVLA